MILCYLGTPESALSMLQFLQCVRERQVEMVDSLQSWKGHPLGPPIVVHCSAGIHTIYISVNLSNITINQQNLY